MKIILVILVFIIPFVTLGQKAIAFEQIAFDFYQDTILKENPPKKRLTLYTDLDNKQFLLWSPQCLEDFKVKVGDNFILNPSKQTKIAIGIDDRFKIKENGKGNYPKVYSTISFSNKINQHIVTIVEIYKHSGTTYHIVMNDEGQVKNWCKGGYIE